MSILLYEEYALAKQQAFARVKDTEKTITITLAVGKGVIIDAHAIDSATGNTITKAYVGQKIKAVVSVRNDGDDDYIWYTVKDKDTGTIIDQPVGNPFLKKGEVLVRTGAELTMPNKDWNWLIEAGHGTA
jgi:ABC-type Fe3+-hydroxamate transport system substrate-binding protein